MRHSRLWLINFIARHTPQNLGGRREDVQPTRNLIELQNGNESDVMIESPTTETVSVKPDVKHKVKIELSTTETVNKKPDLRPKVRIVKQPLTKQPKQPAPTLPPPRQRHLKMFENPTPTLPPPGQPPLKMVDSVEDDDDSKGAMSDQIDELEEAF